MIDKKIVEPYLARLIDKGYIYKETINGSVDEVDEIMYKLIESGEYFIDVTPEPKRWIIRRNSTFQLNRSVKITNMAMRYFTGTVAIAAILSLIIQVKTLCIQRKTLHMQEEKLRAQREKQSQPILLRDTSFSLKDKALLDSSKKTK